MRIIQIASTAKQSANYVDMFAEDDEWQRKPARNPALTKQKFRQNPTQQTKPKTVNYLDRQFFTNVWELKRQLNAHRPDPALEAAVRTPFAFDPSKAVPSWHAKIRYYQRVEKHFQTEEELYFSEQEAERQARARKPELDAKIMELIGNSSPMITLNTELLVNKLIAQESLSAPMIFVSDGTYVSVLVQTGDAQVVKTIMYADRFSEKDLGLVASLNDDFMIKIAGEMSKEDLTAEQLYQKYMTVASQRDAHVAVLHALSEVTREMYPAKSYGPASRMATANIKTVELIPSFNPLSQTTSLQVSVTFYRIATEEGKKTLLDILRVAKPRIIEEVKDFAGIAPTIKFVMSSYDNLGAEPDRDRAIDPQKRRMIQLDKLDKRPDWPDDFPVGTNVKQTFAKYKGLKSLEFTRLSNEELRMAVSAGIDKEALNKSHPGYLSGQFDILPGMSRSERTTPPPAATPNWSDIMAMLKMYDKHHGVFNRRYRDNIVGWEKHAVGVVPPNQCYLVGKDGTVISRLDRLQA